MATYKIEYKIQSNVLGRDLGYQIEIRKETDRGDIYALQKTPILQLAANHHIQEHMSLDIDPKKDLHFILYFMLYRKVGENYLPLFNEPKTKIYTMDNPPKISVSKYENIRYYESKGAMRASDNVDANITVLKITRKERVFEDPHFPAGTQTDPFSYEKINKQLKEREAKQSFPDQQSTSLCGPAAFFYCLQTKRFDLYRQVIWDLWENGRVVIGKLEINPGDKCRHPQGLSETGVIGIDWISLASLRDSENTLMDYKPRELGNKEGLAGITFKGTVKAWFQKIGSECVCDNVNLYMPSNWNHASLKEIVELNKFAGKSNYSVLTIIGIGMLKFGGDSPASKEHWIVWESQLTLLNGGEITEETSLMEKVSLSLFSWGRVMDNYLRDELTLGDFLTYCFGGVVFENFK